MLRAFTLVAVAGAACALSLLPVAASAGNADCQSVDVDYVVNSSLSLRNTRMGAADGTYPSGTGTLRLRVHGPDGAAPRDVRLLSYDVRGRFAIVAHTLAWSTQVVTDARTTVRNSGPAGAARGVLRDGALSWTTRVAGYRTDGTLTCDGSFCGTFGAPPRGQSPLHDGPYDVAWRPFVFSADQKTFTMDFAQLTSTSAQTSFLALAGREVSRTCVGGE